MSDTIFALSSGAPPSAIAIVRMSGPGVDGAVRAVCGALPEPRLSQLVTFSDPVTNTKLDRGICLRFPGPKSFTGEDCAEFHLHGGRAVTNAILGVLRRLDGFRHAEPGEFIRRAFLNGKMNLVHVEGAADLIGAETEQQLRQARNLVFGRTEGILRRWRASLVDILAEITAHVDFSDEGDVSSRDAQWSHHLRFLESELSQALQHRRAAEIVRSGLTVAITGRPNAGKSSLLNALARRDVAIVSPRPGTTRDIIEVRLDLNGFPVTLLDTAGIRDSDDEVEAEGISRAHARAMQADLILWLYDINDVSDPPPSFIPHPALIRVANKADTVAHAGRDLAISAKRGDGLPVLLDQIAAFVSEFGSMPDALFSSDRQFAHLERALQATRRALGLEEMELVAEEVRAICLELDSLVGSVDVENVLESVFARFCVGK